MSTGNGTTSTGTESTETGSTQSPPKLRFGIFDWIEWGDRPANEIYEERLKMLEYADQHGFYSYHLAEHHLTPLSISPSPSIFLSAACQRTKNIRLGPLVYLLPFYNPLRLLHEICMLDQLSNGRLDLGVGRGVSPIEAEHFELEPEKLWDMFNEGLDVLLKGFTNEVLNHEGNYYNYKDIRIWVRPHQQPYPPLWYASNNIETVPWIAQHGFHTSHIFATAADTRPHFDLYKQVWQERKGEAGRLNAHVAEPMLGLTRHVYVAPTDEQAIKECREAYNAWFYNINYLWDQAGSDFLDFLRDFDAFLARGVIIAGSPQSVREQVQQAVDESGINYFTSIFAWGDLTHQQVMRSMDLFVGEVMPNVS